MAYDVWVIIVKKKYGNEVYLLTYYMVWENKKYIW